MAAADGREALEKIESEGPDVVVLDILLGDPEFSGLDVCRRIRESGSQVPVIFLTVKDRTEDPWFMGRAFSLGGDDFVVKREELRRIERDMGLIPTEVLDRKSDVDELIARIKARLPRTATVQEFDEYLRVDIASRRVDIRGSRGWVDAGLTATEFDILQALVASEGKPVAKGALLNAAGIDPLEVDVDRALQSHIWRLRKRIEPDPSNPRFVLTYHRVGYRFAVSITPV